MDPLGKLVVGGVAGLMTVIVTFLVAREWHSYRRGESVVDARQYRFRMAGAVVLYWLIAMMCTGVYALEFSTLLTFAVYWSVFALLALVPVAMSIIDLRRLAKIRRERELALRREMAQFVHERADLLRNARQTDRHTEAAES